MAEIPLADHILDRLAGGKADLWQLRQSEKVLELPFLPTVGRPDRSNMIDIYLTAEIDS